MLEAGRPATEEVVRHVDRCLSCLSCMTTCPSGVNYMHLVDHARTYIEQTYRRPWHERLLRGVLAAVLPRPGCVPRSRCWARGWRGPSRGWCPDAARWRSGCGRCCVWRRRACRRRASPSGRACIPRQGARRARVALLAGCAQQVLAPEINAATIRLLTRLGVEVVVPPDSRLLRRAEPPHGPA